MCNSVVAIMLFGLLMVNSALAYENKVGDYNIGAGAGFVTGYGLSYRQWINRFGAQVTLAPYYARDDYSTYANLDIGFTGLCKINEGKYVNLIGYFGPHLFWWKEEYNHDNDGPDYYSWEDHDEKILFVGGGPGFDIHFWRVSLNFMFGLMGRTNFEGDDGFSMTGEIGLYYSFDRRE